MKAYVFPGQGAQFPGMAKDLYESSEEAKRLLEVANEILGFPTFPLKMPFEALWGASCEPLAGAFWLKNGSTGSFKTT